MSSYKAPQGAHVARICSRSGSSSSILPLWTGAAVRTVRHGGVATVLVAWKDRAVRVIAWQLVTCQIVAVTEKRPEATMIQVTEIRWVAGYRFYFRFSDDSVGACDLAPLLAEASPENPLRDFSYFRMVLLVDGVPTWPNGLKLAPERLQQYVETAMKRTLLLDDTNDAILIGKSGEPVPASDLLNWLAANCRGAWRYRYDGVWNVYFGFEDGWEAESFKCHWKAREF